MLQNAASDQGLHYLQIVQPYFSRYSSIMLPEIPKFEIRFFQYIVWGSFNQSTMGYGYDQVRL